MYFDQYSITSLRYIDISFKNFVTFNLTVGRFISFGFSSGRSCSSCLCFNPFQSFSVCFLQHPLLSFFPFLIVGSAKVRIFSELPNKINFILLSSFFSSSPYFNTLMLISFPSFRTGLQR